MSDPFSTFNDHPSSPARQAYPVAPNDSIILSPLPKALIVGSAGALTLRAVDSPVDVTIVAQAGQMLPVRAAIVRATGTTATGIVALA